MILKIVSLVATGYAIQLQAEWKGFSDILKNVGKSAGEAIDGVVDKVDERLEEKGFDFIPDR